MKKYIIFDLDGTLISSHSNIKDIIFQYFKEKQPEYYDKVRYSLNFNKISSVQDLLKKVYSDRDIGEKHTEIYQYLDDHNLKNDYIKGTIEKILELKEKYSFYLSTGSSTKFAEQILEKGGIKQYFELIIGSDKISKSEEHLDLFMEHSGNKDFFKLSISIGDSPRDELFAKERNIDFIKIGEEYKSISDIKNL